MNRHNTPQNKYKEFVKYFEHKSIALIGSGASILKNEYGKEIDSHNIVVRINRGCPYKRYQKYVGTRTDVWSYGCGQRDDLRKKAHEAMPNRKYSMYPWYASVWVPPYLRKLENNIILPPHFSRTAEKHCGGSPATTGVDTLHFLVTGTTYKSISIFGIDCYRTGYWFIEEDSSIAPTIITEEGKQAHSVNEEERLIQRLIGTYPNITWYK